ncbi:MAG TPA: flippase-like domain-containing protein, partial [Methanomethylovorans sp.]|nr:flippase-like domain-containing protein [Methanomethylovorans sp.]
MNKLKKWIVISLLISLISGALVIALTFDASTLEAIVQIKTEYIILAVLLHIFSLFMQGIRIKTMCGALGYDISIKEATKIVTSSMFVAAITPAAVAGEPLRVHLLNRRAIPLGKATAVILGERLMDALLILSLVPLSLYVMREFLTSVDVCVCTGTCQEFS